MTASGWKDDRDRLAKAESGLFYYHTVTIIQFLVSDMIVFRIIKLRRRP